MNQPASKFNDVSCVQKSYNCRDIHQPYAIFSHNCDLNAICATNSIELIKTFKNTWIPIILELSNVIIV